MNVWLIGHNKNLAINEHIAIYLPEYGQQMRIQEYLLSDLDKNCQKTL
jgi:hypothetical protein